MGIKQSCRVVFCFSNRGRERHQPSGRTFAFCCLTEPSESSRQKTPAKPYFISFVHLFCCSMSAHASWFCIGQFGNIHAVEKVHRAAKSAPNPGHTVLYERFSLEIWDIDNRKRGQLSRISSSELVFSSLRCAYGFHRDANGTWTPPLPGTSAIKCKATLRSLVV
jgi:hypothetical protein